MKIFDSSYTLRKTDRHRRLVEVKTDRHRRLVEVKTDRHHWLVEAGWKDRLVPSDRRSRFPTAVLQGLDFASIEKIS